MMMAQFPFAHTITMTYRLANGALEVETTLQNLSAEPMPVAIAITLLQPPRRPARSMEGTPGRARPPRADQPCWCLPASANRWSCRPRSPCRACNSTTGSPTWSADRTGRAQFWVEGSKQRITVSYGPKYAVAVVYAPRARVHLFEPMAAITNAFSLAHAGSLQGAAKAFPPAASGKRASGLPRRVLRKNDRHG